MAAHNAPSWHRGEVARVLGMHGAHGRCARASSTLLKTTPRARIPRQLVLNPHKGNTIEL
jgi:hypothetical protein